MSQEYVDVTVTGLRCDCDQGWGGGMSRMTSSFQLSQPTKQIVMLITETGRTGLPGGCEGERLELMSSVWNKFRATELRRRGSFPSMGNGMCQANSQERNLDPALSLEPISRRVTTATKGKTEVVQRECVKSQGRRLETEP